MLGMFSAVGWDWTQTFMHARQALYQFTHFFISPNKKTFNYTISQLDKTHYSKDTTITLPTVDVDNANGSCTN